MLYQLGGRAPVLAGDNFIADNASVIGDVQLGRGASVWFNAVLRADNDFIIVGDETNIQDHAVLHVDRGTPLHLGRGVSVAHHAVLHGCKIGDYSLIGIGAVVLNRAQIGQQCIVGASTLIPDGMVVPDGSLVFGNPGRVLKRLDERERDELKKIAVMYRINGQKFLVDLRSCATLDHLPD